MTRLVLAVAGVALAVPAAGTPMQPSLEEMAPGDGPLPEMPGLFRFGGDGAEETFAFDARGDRVSIVMVRDSIDDEDIIWQGDTFTEFLRNVPLYRSD